MKIEEERLREIAGIREENRRVLKEELSSKEVIIRASTAGIKERKYFVEEVKEVRIQEERGGILGVRLCNSLFKENAQPFIKYPPSIITPERYDEKRKKILITYSGDYDLERDFRRLYRKTKEDLSITIIYPG